MNVFQNRLGKTIFTGSLVLAMLTMPVSAFAAPMIPDASVRASELSGNLLDSTSQHFFSIEPNANDSDVTLTLTFGSVNDGRIANNVNFRIFDQSGMRQLQDGVKASEASFGGGSPIYGKDDNFKVNDTFQVSGKQGYSVMVYSNASAPANYTLRADNALLVDTSGRSQPAELMADMIDATQPAKMEITQPVNTDTSKKISAQNVGNGDRQYYTLQAISNDEEVTLNFDYSPQDNGALKNKFNFYVFSANTLRQLEAGGRPEIINLAAGNLVKVNETQLRATFRSVGSPIFTVIVVNRSDVTATYTLRVDGADFQ